MRYLLLAFVGLSVASCDSVILPPDSPPTTPPTEQTPGPPPPARVPMTVAVTTPLIGCPAGSTSDVWYSLSTPLEGGGALVYEQYPCRSQRIHRMDESGALVETDSVDVPQYPTPAPGGFYYIVNPATSPAALAWAGPGGERRVMATVPGRGGRLIPLRDGGVLVAGFPWTGDPWTLLRADGQVQWSLPVPAGADWAGVDAAGDGGLFAVGCEVRSPVNECVSSTGSDRVMVRLGASGAVEWTSRIPWDGVTAWTFDAVRALPGGGAIAIGGSGGWLYGRSPEDPALRVARFGPDGALLWDRALAGWGRFSEIAWVTGMALDGDYLMVDVRHFDPAAAGASYRYAGLVLSLDGEVVRRSSLGAEYNGRPVDLGDGRWGRAASAGDVRCGRSGCTGSRSLAYEILR